jgi:hypothetical protein
MVSASMVHFSREKSFNDLNLFDETAGMEEGFGRFKAICYLFALPATLQPANDFAGKLQCPESYCR